MAGSGSKIRAGGAFVSLGLDDKLGAGLQRASARLKSFAGGAASIGAPLAAVSGGILGALGLPLKLSAEMEQTATSFEVMLGSAQKAEALLARLQQLGAETPFEFPELADAGKKLLAFGSDAATLPDELRRLGDVASGVGMPIGELSELYGKMRTQGTLYAEDLNQLLGRGIPALQMFADQMGVPVDQVKKLGSEGKITFSMLEQMMLDLTKEGGRFAGMMQKQSATTAGRWSTFKDNVTASLRAVGEALLPVANQVMDFGSQIIAGFAPMLPAISQAIPAIFAVTAGLGAVGTALLAVAGGAAAFGWVAASVASVASLAAGIGLVAGSVWMLRDELAPIFDWMSQGFQWVANTAQAAWRGISDALAAGDLSLASEIALTGLKLAFATGMESIAGIFGVSIDQMAQTLASLWKRLGQFVASLNNIRAEASQWLAEAMGSLVGVEVTREDNALLSSAAAWSDSWDKVDTGKLQAQIAEALDPEQYRQQMEELIAKAGEARLAVQAAQDQAAMEQPALQPAAMIAGAKQELEAAFASVGSFGAQFLDRMQPGGKSVADKQLAVAEKQLKAQEATNAKLDDLGGMAFTV